MQTAEPTLGGTLIVSQSVKIVLPLHVGGTREKLEGNIKKFSAGALGPHLQIASDAAAGKGVTPE